MCADDVNAWSGPVEYQPLKNIGAVKIFRQPIILRAGAVKRIEGQDGEIFHLPSPNIVCGLLQSLSPINIGIIEEGDSSSGTAGHFVEVRDVVRKGGNAGPGVPGEKSSENGNTRSCREKIRNDAAYPDEEQRECWKNIADSDLTGAHRNHYDVKRDACEQDHFAPRIDETSGCSNCCENDEDERWEGSLKRERNGEVVPPSTRLEFAEQIKSIVTQVVRIDEAHVSKIQERRSRKQVRRFNHEEGCCPHDEEALYLPADQTEGDKDDRQGRSGEFAGHRGAARQTRKDIALPRRVFVSFPEEIKGQNREHGQWNISRHQHSVSEKVRAERIKREGEYTCRTPEEIARPHKRHRGSNCREEDHRGSRPEEEAISVISIKKLERERVFDSCSPTLLGSVESWPERQEGKCSQQFCQRRVFGIHSEVPRFPIAVAGRYMNRLIGSGGQSRYSEHRFNAKNNDEAGGGDV